MSAFFRIALVVISLGQVHAGPSHEGFPHEGFPHEGFPKECSPENDPAKPFGAMSKVCQDLAATQADPEKLSQWSASVKQIKAAPCLRRTPFTEAEMLAELDDDAATRPGSESRVIHGVSFTDENPRLLDLFEKLTTYTDLDAKDNPSKQPRFTSSCTKVLCAVKEIFGAKVGVQSLFGLSRYGYNTSHYVLDGTTPWRADELDTVLLGLASYPEHSLPIEDNHPLIHLTHGVGNGHTIANATVMIFDAWDRLPPEERLMTIVHELGHNFATHAGGADYSKTWVDMSKWKTLPSVDKKSDIDADWEAGDKTAVVSRYADTNPSEDFAESVAAYRLNGAWLQRRSPDKFNFLKEVVFDGLDYLSESGCKRQSDSARLSEAAQKKIDADEVTGGVTIDSKVSLGVRQACSDQIIAAAASSVTAGAASRESLARLDGCVAKAVGGAVVRQLAMPELKYPEFSGPMLAQRASLAVSGEVVAQARKVIDADVRATMASFVALSEKGASYELLTFGTSSSEPGPVDWCRSVANSALSAADDADLSGAFDASDKYFAYRHVDELKSIVEKTCLAAHLGHYPIVQLTAATAATALGELPAKVAVADLTTPYGAPDAPKLEALQARVRAECDALYLARRFDDAKACAVEVGPRSYGLPEPDWAREAALSGERARLQKILVDTVLLHDRGRSYLHNQKAPTQKFCEDFPGGYPQGSFELGGMNEKAGYPAFYGSHSDELFKSTLTKLCLRVEQLAGGATGPPMRERDVRQAVEEYLDPRAPSGRY